MPLGLGDLLDIGGLVTSVLGVGSAKKEARAARRERAADRRQAQAQFDAQMDQSVQRRVKDAQAAGVHPLFAMGASVGTSPTMSVGGSSGLSGGVADAIAAVSRQLGQTSANRARAKRDEAEAALINSQRKKLEQELVSRGHDGAQAGGSAEGIYQHELGDGQTMPLKYGLGWMEKPREIKPQNPDKPGTQAGPGSPSMIPLTLPGGREITIPDPEVFEEPWSPATLFAVGKGILGLTDQEIWRMAKQVGSFFARHGKRAGLTDQQIVRRLKEARDWAKGGLQKGKRYYSKHF